MTKIEDVADKTHLRKQAVVIEVEGDEWEPAIDRSPEIVKEIKLTQPEIIQRIKDCGICREGINQSVVYR